MAHAPVAQLDRAMASGAMCRTFESCQAHICVNDGVQFHSSAASHPMDTNSYPNPISLASTERWIVPFADSGHWRVGIYNPEFTSSGEITILEKHSCPELFICRKGRMGLVIGNGNREKIVVLSDGEAILVTDYHNGFRIDEIGDFLVVERTAFTTEYIDRKTGKIIRIVETSE